MIAHVEIEKDDLIYQIPHSWHWTRHRFC